jgi:branched-chain amino acid transport system permease protein
MTAVLTQVRRFGAVSILVAFVIALFLPLVFEGLFAIRLMIFALLFGFFVMSWDVLSGTTEEINFGHAFWLLAGGYTAAWLSLYLDLGPWYGVPLGALAACVLGLLAGLLTLRLRGPYFALVTLALAASLYKINFIFSGVFGGEEGVSGVAFLSRSFVVDYYIILGFLAVSYLVLHQYYQSRYGLVLKGIKADDDLTRASGHNTSYYKIVTFGIAMFFAGIAGALYTHVQGHINAELAAGVVSAFVVLYAMVGSRGTLHGPLAAGVFFFLLNQWLRVIEQWRVLLFMGLLMLAIYLFPDGIVNQARATLRRLRKPAEPLPSGGVEETSPTEPVKG